VMGRRCDQLIFCWASHHIKEISLKVHPPPSTPIKSLPKFWRLHPFSRPPLGENPQLIMNQKPHLCEHDHRCKSARSSQ
jgi:hypothetical protein